MTPGGRSSTAAFSAAGSELPTDSNPVSPAACPGALGRIRSYK